MTARPRPGRRHGLLVTKLRPRTMTSRPAAKKTATLFADDGGDFEFEMDDKPGIFAGGYQDAHEREEVQDAENPAAAMEDQGLNTSTAARPAPKATPQPRATQGARAGLAPEPRIADRSRSPHVVPARMSQTDSLIAQLRQDIATRDAMINTLNQSMAAVCSKNPHSY